MFGSGVRAHCLKVARQRCHADGELCSGMSGRIAVVAMLVEKRLLNLHARRAFAGERARPVNLKALSADRTAYVTITFGSFTQDLHRRLLHPAVGTQQLAGWNLRQSGARTNAASAVSGTTFR